MTSYQLKSHRGGQVETMAWHKRLQVFLICWLAYLLIRLLVATLRFQVTGQDHRNKAETIHPQKAFAIATWHENAICGITGHANQGICIMISPSIDGEIISWIANRFGLKSIRGSSSRRGREALLGLLRYVKQGGQVAFTVDGPRGPRHEVKAGIVALAAKTGTPILPMGAIPERYWVLAKTWDKFRVPKPFSKVHVIYGEPIIVENSDNPAVYEEAKLKVSQALAAIEAHAARYRIY